MQDTPAHNKSVRSEDSEVTNNKIDSQATHESSSPSLGAKSRARQAEKTEDNELSSPAPQDGSDGDPGKESGDWKVSPEVDADKAVEEESSSESDVEPIEKEETIPKTIRLTKKAFAALVVLMGKYEKGRGAMTSIAIISYAKGAAAASIVRYRLLCQKALFALQASATDIKDGLGKLEKDLYAARKSHRDPKERKLLYDQLSAKYQKVLRHAEETLTLMDKECLLHDLLDPSDHVLLIQLIVQLEALKPKNRIQRQSQELQLKIFKILIL